MKACMTAAAVIASCAGLTRAQTDLYISEYKFNDAQFSAVRTDGTNPRTLFPLPAAFWLPIGIDFDVATGKLMWMDSAGASEIVTANVNGSGLATLTGVPGFARTVSRDAAGRIFFSTFHEIMRVNANGTGLTTVFTGHDSFFTAGNPVVDATNGHFYVGYLGEILRFDLDGNNKKVITTKGSSIRAIGLDVENRHLYWIDADPHTDFVARVNLDGSDFRVLHDVTPNVSQSSGLIELLVDGPNGDIYYADELAGLVYRADLDGSNRSVIFSSASGRAPSGLALSTGAPVQALNDCDGNGIADDIDIANGEPDCDNNGVPDSCQTNPCPDWTILLDQGSNAPESSGRSLGVPGSEWEVFQPFDVPASGWSIGQIALDGYTVWHVGGLGFTVTVHPDNGTGTRPDEGVTLAQTGDVNYYYNTNNENWVYAPLSAELGAGRYWLHLRANEPDIYWGFVNLGTSGLQSISRGASGNFTAPASPIAVQLIERVCMSDYDGNDEVDILDFLNFIDDFSACENQPGPCGSFGDADVNGDGFVDILDFLDFIDAFAGGC